MFKLKDNIEILLSFIFNPTKYEPANCVNIFYLYSGIKLNINIRFH